MVIARFSVKNYKSFHDSGSIELRPGFNILTGQNNAGKTTLLQALTLNFPEAPHRSMLSIPHAGGIPPGGSVVELALTFEIGELQSMLRNANTDIWLPAPALGT